MTTVCGPQALKQSMLIIGMSVSSLVYCMLKLLMNVTDQHSVAVIQPNLRKWISFVRSNLDTM